MGSASACYFVNALGPDLKAPNNRVSACKCSTLLAGVLPNCEGLVLATGVLHGFPVSECGFDCQKMSSFAIIGVLLDGSACPCEPAAACWANGIFRENLGQGVRELTIKFRNVCVWTHDASNLRSVRSSGSCDGAAAHW